MLKVILRGLLHKQTIFRALFEYALNQQSPSQGYIIDLGGVKQPIPGYAKALRAEMAHVAVINIATDVGADIVADAANTGLPSQSADEVWAFNVLEHIEYPEHILVESKRLLKTTGRFIGVMPFLLGIHGEPDDFVRYTKSKLLGVLRDSNFIDYQVVSIGKGPFIAGLSQIQPILPRIISIPLLLCAWLFDEMVFFLRPQWQDRWPLGYLMIARTD